MSLRRPLHSINQENQSNDDINFIKRIKSNNTEKCYDVIKTNNDCSAIIFSFLNPVDISKASLVSRRWYSTLTDGTNIKPFLTSISKYSRPKIYLSACKNEHLHLPKKNIILQPQISPHMRAILIGWLSDVANATGQHSTTLFTSVSLIDRLISLVKIPSDEFQLVGLASILISTKLEEQMNPTVDQLLSHCDNIYSSEQLLLMELSLLKHLKFSVHSPTIIFFVEYIAEFCNLGDIIRNIGRYLAEKSLLEVELIDQPPSIIATTILCLACYYRSITYLPILFASGYSHIQLRTTARVLTQMSERVQPIYHEEEDIEKKYDCPNYQYVSKLPVCRTLTENQLKSEALKVDEFYIEKVYEHEKRDKDIWLRVFWTGYPEYSHSDPRAWVKLEDAYYSPTVKDYCKSMNIPLPPTK